MASASALLYTFVVARPRRDTSLPKEHRRLYIDKSNTDLSQVKFRIEQEPLPQPRYGQVLVRVAAVAINPSDFNEWKSPRSVDKPFGNEASGVVVASGGGFLAGQLMGKKVGILRQGRTKTAAEYVCLDATSNVWSLPDAALVEDAAGWFINPFTVLAILSTASKHGTGLVHTGASSQLGQMMVKRIAQANKQGSKKMTLVNVVRREEHVDQLKRLGAEHVICQASKESWLKELKKEVEESKIRVSFDAVSGDMSGQLLANMPKKGLVYVYGVLAGQPVGQIDPLDLIYRQKQIKGFLVGDWISQGGPLVTAARMYWATQQVGSQLSGDGWAASQYHDCTMAASQYHDCTMETMESSFSELVQKGFTGKKLRIRMY